MNRNSIEEYLKTKDDNLKNKIIVEHEPLVNDIICKRFNYPSEKEDLMQVGRLGILKAIDRYDPNKGKFSTLLTRIITNHIIMHLKKNSHEFGSHLHRRVNMGDAPLAELYDEKSDIGVFDAVRHVFSRLPEKDVKVLKSTWALDHGKYTYFEKNKAMNNFRKVMQNEGITREDFYTS